MFLDIFVFFFFKQKTAYEMRISDWSSDVCSSDLVGELPLSVQAKLLRALQNGEIQRLGADQTIKTDVRIIAATNRQLKESTSAGNFRADLYHRLSVYPVHIPPLRERGRDVLILAGHFLEIGRAHV